MLARWGALPSCVGSQLIMYLQQHQDTTNISHFKIKWSRQILYLLYGVLHNMIWQPDINPVLPVGYGVKSLFDPLLSKFSKHKCLTCSGEADMLSLTDNNILFYLHFLYSAISFEISMWDIWITYPVESHLQQSHTTQSTHWLAFKWKLVQFLLLSQVQKVFIHKGFMPRNLGLSTSFTSPYGSKRIFFIHFGWLLIIHQPSNLTVKSRKVCCFGFVTFTSLSVTWIFVSWWLLLSKFFFVSVY